jgi:rhamnosyltransferase
MIIEKTAAIFTTYKPDSNFRKRIEDVVNFCEIVIVVDNTPGGFNFIDKENINIVQDGVNKGLGRALNIGIKKAVEAGCDSVILFDQDSGPSEEILNELKDALLKLGVVKKCVGPRFVDDAIKNIENIKVNGEKLEKLTCLPTSGMMFSLYDIHNQEYFSEELFLDFVDFDWCWRMRKNHDWDIYRVSTALMPHRLGIEQRKLFNLTYHIPSPYRHYFQFRDTLNLLKFNYVPYYSKFRLGLILIPKILIYPFILNNGLERFIWMIKGLKDFILGVHGVGAVGKFLTK